jgi:hypothetical protein
MTVEPPGLWWGRLPSEPPVSNALQTAESAPVIAAVVSPEERPRLDAASGGWFSLLHRESLPDVVRVVRERAVDAVLLSVRQCAARLAEPPDA